MRDEGMIETFRVDDLLLRHSRNFLSGIHVFAFFFGLKDCGPLIEPFRGDG